ncbi:hypothetical protein FOZ60_001248 [Perkinsus olseni]|uniref:Uncharacterized protein n=1 Tax=Perkinsus olseni TaxID=32597 RepID=A0A7J6P348_PEROL|nr:hypothetical protein FOZ60_001248 [Perkinsus olseni]
MFTTTAPSSSTVTTTLPESTATAVLSLDALDLESFSLDKVLRFTTAPAGAGELPGAQGTDEVHSESTKPLFSAEQLKNMNLDRTLAPWDSVGTPPTEIKEPLSDGVEDNVAQTKRSVVDSGSPSAENSKILVAVLVIAAGILAIVCLQLAAMVVWFCRWHQTTKATVDGGARAGQAGSTPAAEAGPGDDAQRLDLV